MGKKYFVIILLVLALLLQTVSAQNDDIMTLLRQDAAGNQQTLGAYLWKLLHGKYTNLGDMAASSFMAFLEEGVDQSFTLNGSTVRIYIITAIDGNEEFNPRAYYKVNLILPDDSESGMMIMQLDAIKNYVNSSLYPRLKTALNSPDSSSQLMQDLSGLLSKCTILPPNVSENSILENMWSELAENSDSYPGIMALLNTPSEEPLVIFEKGPWYPEQDGVLTGLLDNIDSGASLLNAFKVFNTTPTDNPLSDDTSDTLQERIEELVRVITITFDPNGGTGSMDPQKTHVRIPTELAANTFTLEGSCFIGWNTKADGSGIPYEDQDTISIEADTTLYAQWTSYEITQDSAVTRVDFINEETMTQIEAKTEVTGVTLNVENGAVQDLVDTALENADEDTKAAVEAANEIVIEIIVNVIPTEFEEESVSFRLEPKANIIAKDALGHETPVADNIDVTNDMIDKSAAIRVSIYVGFEPVQIIHYDDNEKVIEVFTKGNFTYNEASG
ncbi:MAG: InlB B-repeat-containing protein, partial [Anaerolineaceae bacterium]|nr:InlB B-repeat-containing protein [Anaerolineaceae bacterium]